LLRFLYDYVHNYGVAIVLMTIIIKILFWPLSQKSYRSMQQMKQLQPLMQRLREKYKDDKETMNREVMQLYKTYKVNPAGGCLPILVQLPVFFGLYQALLNAIELRHAPFITHLPFTDLPWLADLASPDPFFITPLAMGATMLLQQKMTPSPGDPTQAKILMLMPIVFTGLFLTFPSGLVVYWLINNVISIGQQWWQMRKGA
jgi:YidC/Oxa1 family membrane protein insertase